MKHLKKDCTEPDFVKKLFEILLEYGPLFIGTNAYFVFRHLRNLNRKKITIKQYDDLRNRFVVQMKLLPNEELDTFEQLILFTIEKFDYIYRDPPTDFKGKLMDAKKRLKEELCKLIDDETYVHLIMDFFVLEQYFKIL